MNRRTNARDSSDGPAAALERELDQALAATFPASDPVAVDSAEEHRARLSAKKRRGRPAGVARRRRK